jgi:ribonuclease P protein component
VTEAGNRFRKSERLRKRHEFLNLAISGRQCQNRYFIIRYGVNKRGLSRLGITVTKRTGGAVIRNRLKRILREFFRINRPRIPIGVDYNIIVKNTAVALTTEQIYKVLEALFDEISHRINTS